jgi:hypothetical protein
MELQRNKMRRNLVAAMTLVLATSIVHATPVTVKVQVDVRSYFDYPTRTLVPAEPISGVVSFTFDADQVSTLDYGATTISTFGGVLGTSWSSPLTALVPLDPYSGGYGNLYNSYVFPNVNDYPSTFIEEGASQANTFRTDGINYAAYHIEVRATRRSSPRAGDGTSDFAFNRTTLLNFYRSFIASGEAVYFNESYETYTFKDGSAVYSSGKSWSDYSGRIIEVIDHAAVVPEPSTWALLLSGVGVLLLGTSRRRQAHSIASANRGAQFHT